MRCTPGLEVTSGTKYILRTEVIFHRSLTVLVTKDYAFLQELNNGRCAVSMSARSSAPTPAMALAPASRRHATSSA